MPACYGGKLYCSLGAAKAWDQGIIMSVNSTNSRHRRDAALVESAGESIAEMLEFQGLGGSTEACSRLWSSAAITPLVVASIFTKHLSRAALS